MPVSLLPIWRTSVTPDSESSSAISSTGVPTRSLHLITPLQELRDLWGETFTSSSPRCFIDSKLVHCCLFSISSRRVPTLVFLTLLTVPALTAMDLAITNSETLANVLPPLRDSMTRNLGQLPQLYFQAVYDFFG